MLVNRTTETDPARSFSVLVCPGRAGLQRLCRNLCRRSAAHIFSHSQRGLTPTPNIIPPLCGWFDGVSIVFSHRQIESAVATQSLQARVRECHVILLPPLRLNPFDGGEPGRCAVVVDSCLKPVRFDSGDIPSTAGVERRSQLFLTDGVRASIGTIVTEAQHVQLQVL